jgi:hypothetical protein
MRTLEEEKMEVNQAKRQLEDQLKSAIEVNQLVALQLKDTEVENKEKLESVQSKLHESKSLVEENRILVAILKEELAQDLSIQEGYLLENSNLRNDLEFLTGKRNLSIRKLAVVDTVPEEKVCHVGEDVLNRIP